MARQSAPVDRQLPPSSCSESTVRCPSAIARIEARPANGGAGLAGFSVKDRFAGLTGVVMAVPAPAGGFMLWSGSSPGSAVRDGMWGFLLFAGVTWLAISWSVLRLEPGDVAGVAGPVILFAAVTEAVRALAGTRTWWLNAGMALLFAATGGLLLADDTSSWTTPAALIGWYLLVRGAVDIAISMMSRETDRIWGLLLVLGVAETGLGFFAASAFARRADLVVVVLAGAALARGVADLVAALRLREATAAAQGERLLELPPERAVGVAGYTAGLTDFEAGGPAGGGARPRHRAAPRTSAAAMSDLAAPGFADPVRPTDRGGPSGSFHDEVLRTTADLDAMLALAGVTGAAVPGAAARAAAEEQIEVPDTPEGAELPALEGATAARRRAAPAEAATAHRQAPAEEATAHRQAPAEEATPHRQAATRRQAAAEEAAAHRQDEMATGGWITPDPGREATAGWTGSEQDQPPTARPADPADPPAAHRRAAPAKDEGTHRRAAPAEDEGTHPRAAPAEDEGTHRRAAPAVNEDTHPRAAPAEDEHLHRRAAHEEMAAMHRRASIEDPSLPLLDPAARAAAPGLEDTSIIMRNRRLD
jgi:uncharacterized membrane protein HdeD (DUF308 family)